MGKIRQLVDAADQQAIEDLLARYCWAMDDGDGDAYAECWTEDGVLTGFGDPIKGPDGLKALVAATFDQSAGKWRHMPANLLIQYDGGHDGVRARFYNQVTRWGDAPGLQAMVLADMRLARTADGWKVAAADLSFL